MMTARTRAIRWGRWTCVLLTVALSLLYFRSAFHPGLAVYAPFGYLGISDGMVVVHFWPMPGPGQPRMPYFVGNFDWNPRGMRWWPEFGGARSGTRVCMPLWVVLMPALALAILAWRRGRVPSGACRACGYDLTGNVSGRCPECGRSVLGP